MEPPVLTPYIFQLARNSEGDIVLGDHRYFFNALRLNYPPSEEKIRLMREGCICRALVEVRCHRIPNKITASSWEGFQEIAYRIE